MSEHSIAIQLATSRTNAKSSYTCAPQLHDKMQTTVMMRPAGLAARLPVRAPSQSHNRVRQRFNMVVRAEETTTAAPATSTPPLDNSQPKPQLDSYSVRLSASFLCDCCVTVAQSCPQHSVSAQFHIDTSAVPLR